MASYILVRADTTARFQFECDLKMGEGFIPTGGVTIQDRFYVQAFYKLEEPFYVKGIYEFDDIVPDVKKATKKVAPRKKNVRKVQ